METIGATQTAQSLREAFSQRGGDETRYARAALLLGLGLMLHPPSDESKQDFVEDAELEWPRVHELERPIESPFENDIVQELEADRKKFGQIAVEERWMGNLIKMLYEDGPDQATNAAFGLIRLSMNSEDPLLRAAACLSWMDTTNQPNEALMHLATIAMSHENNLARFIAIRGLFRLIEPPPSEPRMTRYIQPPPISLEIKALQAVIVHGTIFEQTGKPIDEWWKPGSGDFHQYLKQGPRPNVYSGNDYFRWSGGWNDYAREEATEKLIDWLDRHGIDKPDVFAHSHGCNVSMMATKQRRMSKLVLMSCPVHWHLYQPDFNNVEKVISIRIKWDLVIMADRGAQHFRSPYINEKILPIWFKNHEDSRLSSTWKKRSLDKLL